MAQPTEREERKQTKQNNSKIAQLPIMTKLPF